MRDPVAAIGRGSSTVGLLFVLAASHGRHPWLLLTGEVLIALSIVLFVVWAWKRWTV